MNLRLCLLSFSVFPLVSAPVLSRSEPAERPIASLPSHSAPLPARERGVRGTPSPEEPSAKRSSHRQPTAFGDAESYLHLDQGEGFPAASAVDTGAGFAYYAFSQDPAVGPGEIVKVRISDLTRVDTLVLAPGESVLTCAAIDPGADALYVATYGAPGNVIKIRLSDFSRQASLTFQPGEDYPRVAVLDSAHGFAYFGLWTSPGFVVKVRLSDFTRVGALKLDPDENDVHLALIDSVGEHAYFTAGNGALVKVRLSDFSRTAGVKQALPLATGAISPDGLHAYFGTGGQPGLVVKIRLSDLAEVGRLPGTGTDGFATSAIDPNGTFAYFGSYSDVASRLNRVLLSDFSWSGSLGLTWADGYLNDIVLDAPGNTLLLQTYANH